MSVDITFEERQQIGLEILDEINRVCTILNLRYYLAYGTLLGAIRHDGFIPWDDDIDIWMSREDYIRFNREFNNAASKDFKLLTYYEDENYPFLAPKVVSMKTEVVEKLMKPVKDLGIWVDIFPMDYVDQKTLTDTKELTRLEHRRWMALYRVSTMGAKIKLFFYNLIQRDTKWSDRNEKPGHISRELNELSCNMDYTDKIFCPGSEGDLKIILDSVDFKNTVNHKFEDRVYPIPAGFDDILNKIYGEYMTPPPVNKQKRAKHLKVAKWK